MTRVEIWAYVNNFGSADTHMHTKLKGIRGGDEMKKYVKLNRHKPQVGINLNQTATTQHDINKT